MNSNETEKEFHIRKLKEVERDVDFNLRRLAQQADAIAYARLIGDTKEEAFRNSLADAIENQLGALAIRAARLG